MKDKPGVGQKAGLFEKESQCLQGELEARVIERTAELGKAQAALEAENSELKRREELLRQTNQHFLDVLSASSVVIYSLRFHDGDLKPAWISSNIARFSGYTSEEVLTPGWWGSRLHPDDRGRVVAESSQPFPLDRLRTEYRVQHKNGHYFWVQDEKLLLRDAGGEPREVVGSWVDITERRQIEEVLRESEERFSGAFEHAPIGLALVSPSGQWLKVNRALCQLVGYTEAELLTRTFQELTHPDDLEVGLENVRRLLAGEIPSYQLEKRYLHRCGHVVTVWLHVSLLRDSQGHPRYFISQMQDITERKRNEDALRESHEKFNLLADNITDAFWIRSPDMRQVHYVSPAFSLIWGRPQNSLEGNPNQWADFIVPEDRERVQAAFETLTGAVPHLDIEYRISRPSGEIRWIRVRGFQVRDSSGKLIRLTGIVTDITDRRRLEARLFEAQKLETVGKLAGGVAHEFNSILTAIIGQSRLLLDDLPAESPMHAGAGEILQASERAAALTRQLLAYGRKQILQPGILDLNAVLAGLDRSVRNLMGPDVAVEIIAASGLKAVKADAGQIEQVILNLAMNAADAMPRGGKLTLETSNVWFDEKSGESLPDLEPGGYVLLTITDTGTGMSPEVKAHMFEPFFSTKGVGQGTGLGLSTCYGIIKQSAGHILVESELAQGASFRIYLPQVDAPLKPAVRPFDSPSMPRGAETILLAEDDPAVRGMVAGLLRRLGYTVLAAADGAEGLRLMEQATRGSIHLLFTDVLMPNMNGKELSERARALSPGLKILFTSGYTESEIVQQGVLNEHVAFLQKPFTPSVLAQKLREILD